MFPAMMRCVKVLFAATLGISLAPQPALAQTPLRQSYLSGLQQQNALNQQQNAVQTAVQQTFDLAQRARQRVAAPNAIYFQRQEYALQVALQQTLALKQLFPAQSSARSQVVFQQNALQNALQQTLYVQNSLPQQGNPLTALQRQMLLQEQNSLMGLVGVQLPPQPRKSPSK
jgi:hypothetical protein